MMDFDAKGKVILRPRSCCATLDDIPQVFCRARRASTTVATNLGNLINRNMFFSKSNQLQPRLGSHALHVRSYAHGGYWHMHPVAARRNHEAASDHMNRQYCAQDDTLYLDAFVPTVTKMLECTTSASSITMKLREAGQIMLTAMIAIGDAHARHFPATLAQRRSVQHRPLVFAHCST